MMEAEHPFDEWTRLEQPRLGTRVVVASDEFFGAKERLIEPREPVFIRDKYDDHGKWVDGWETRRKRGPGHDWCIVRLGVPGIVHGVDIDTSYFTGNFPPHASVDGGVNNGEVRDGPWTPIVERTALRGNAHHYLRPRGNTPCTHVRLNIFPDGGIARLRLFGKVCPDPARFDGVVDLFAVENGGRALSCSNQHFGCMHNLNLPGRGRNPGDGWETARRRGPGNDWVVVALGRPGRIVRAEIDTAHFKGNFPDCVSLEAARFEDTDVVTDQSARWRSLLPKSRLRMDRQHVFERELKDPGAVSHVRMSIYPDGGVSRLRLFGEIQSSGFSP